jgi:hypothetical protein
MSLIDMDNAFQTERKKQADRMVKISDLDLSQDAEKPGVLVVTGCSHFTFTHIIDEPETLVFCWYTDEFEQFIRIKKTCNAKIRY